MSESSTVQAVEGLFSQTSEGPRLLGSRCANCRTPYFPRSETCHNPECDRSDMQDDSFGPEGRLISIALQNYPPPPPTIASDPYVTYGVGLVDLPEGLRVIGRLLAEDPEQVPVGGNVALVIAPLGHDSEGREVLSWQWKPI